MIPETPRSACERCWSKVTAMSTAVYPHIEIGSDGVAAIKGTTTKVLEVVLDRLAYHWDADEIRRQHPHLSLAQIHSALAYDHDHQDEMDRDIERRAREAESVREQAGESDMRLKLKGTGPLP